ncbi:MAG: hypothetical protein IKN80_06100 [Clostridiales bacterium]|nr:hypothetical protein [Clostridiales bacterium]
MRKNKRGTSTLFLAIILSALILTETTYIALVADLDRRLTYSRALKEQAEVYLASYDRQLFKTYGIYAFDTRNINSYVFDRVLSANGYEEGDVIYASGMYSLDTDQLKRAVSVYYSYRLSGILFDRFSSQITQLIEQAGGEDILNGIRQFMSGPAAETLSTIIDGGSEVAQTISSALETLGIDSSNEYYQRFSSLISSLKTLKNNAPDIGNGFDPTDMGFVSDIIEFNMDLYNTGAAFNETFAVHSCLADYAANNFDCALEDDTSFNGTSFTQFHGDNEYDSEYILTGLQGFAGKALTYYYIYGGLVIKNIASDLLDPSTREIISAVADILSVVISAVSLGTVTLPPVVYEIIIALIMAEIEAVADLWKIINGESVTFISIGGFDVLTMDYRKFLTVYMYLVIDDLLLGRMLDVLNRDFPDYATGIEVQTDYRGETICYEASYDLYQ